MKHERTAATVHVSTAPASAQLSAAERCESVRERDLNADEQTVASSALAQSVGVQASACDVDWRSQLSGASPREVLARLIAKDSLGLRQRVAAALAEHCYLLDADRVWLRAVARVARFSTRYRGEPALERWLRSQIDDAIGDCIENAQLPADGEPGTAGGFESLARPLGLDPARMEAACAALNACPAPERVAFFALVLDREDLDRAAARLALTPTECARAARRALEQCMRAAMPPDRASAESGQGGAT